MGIFFTTSCISFSEFISRLLLLYSPDTKLFRELQEAIKSFLDLACHCDVYDLFDDALFDTIALDPSEWLEEFLADRNVKIIVISSIGENGPTMVMSIGLYYNLPLSRCSPATAGSARRVPAEPP